MAKRRSRKKLKALESTAAGKLSRATDALPGTEEKIKVMTERVQRRQECHADGDLIHDPTRALHVKQAANGTFLVDGTQEVRAEDGAFSTVKNCVESFGDRLHRLRKAKGWALKNLSRKTGISISALCYYENGGRSPIMEQLLALADALEVSLDELAGRSRRS